MKLILIVIVLLIAGCAQVQEHAPVDGEDTRAPIGYIDFCERNPEEC